MNTADLAPNHYWPEEDAAAAQERRIEYVCRLLSFGCFGAFLNFIIGPSRYLSVFVLAWIIVMGIGSSGRVWARLPAQIRFLSIASLVVVSLMVILWCFGVTGSQVLTSPLLAIALVFCHGIANYAPSFMRSRGVGSRRGYVFLVADATFLAMVVFVPRMH